MKDYDLMRFVWEYKKLNKMFYDWCVVDFMFVKDCVISDFLF